MGNLYLALYKHKRPIKSVKDFVYRISDDLTKILTKGKYSHCEIVIKQKNGKYQCYTSSIRDKGVRVKDMELPLDRWDLIELTQFNVSQIKRFYNKTKGCKYDFLGALGVVLHFGNNKKRYFCSEWCAEALGLPEPHKFSPNSLYRYLRFGI